MQSGFEKRISLGGRMYLDEQILLDFLHNRARLIIEKLCVQDTPLGATEHLRGRYFEIQVITNELQKPPE